MTAEQTLFETLRDDAGVGAIAGNRIYPNKMPQGTTLPAITYTRVTSDPGGSLLGDTSGLDRVYMQVDCWGKTYGTVQSLRGAIRTAMKTITAMPIEQRDDYEDDTEIYRIQLDYYIWDSP